VIQTGPIHLPADEAAASTPGRTGIARLLPKTLTGRLVTGVVALAIVLVAITGSATYAALRSFLYKRLDQQVVSIARQNAGSIIEFLNDPRVSGRQGPPLIFTGQTVWLAVINPDGSVPTLGFSNNAYRQLNLSEEQAVSFIAHTNEVRVMSTTDGVRLHVESVPLRNGTYLVVGLSTHEVQKTLSQLVLLELGIGAIAVALAAGLTTWGVRVGLRPLHRVTRTAQEVTAELGPDGAGLDRRVPDADDRTEVGQVASSVNTLLQAVETEFGARLASEQRMRQFLADASHELRTPLTSIRGYAELSRLQSQSTSINDDPMRRIEVEGTRMSRLVDDLLVLARGDQGNPMPRDPVAIDPLVSEAVRAAESAHPERSFEAVLSGGAIVTGDRDQLLRLLLNLLTNAAVHTAADGPIRLEAVQGRVPSGPAVALKVIDAGPGLPPEEVTHVFERFWRADKARSRAKGGSGLGMAIVAQIVHAHSGSVQFDSSVESGTTVTVTLALAAAAPTAR
jgi:two-component system OmpR family sensor kinase